MAGAYVQGFGPKASAPEGLLQVLNIRLCAVAPSFVWGGVMQQSFRMSKPNRRAIELLVASSIPFLLVACSSSAGSANDSGGQGNPALPQEWPAEGATWEVERATDQMTDTGYDVARVVLSGETFDVEATATCTDRAAARYTFVVFDKDAQPAPFRTVVTFGSPHYSLQIRRDQERPYNHMEFRSAYENQVQVRGREAAQAIAADVLTLRFFMLDGTETLKLDQSSEAFRGAMARCFPVTHPDRAPTAALDGGGTPVSAGESEEAMARPLRADEIAEIEAANGRPYQPGDTIHGRAENAVGQH